MATDSNRNEDDVTAHLNGARVDGSGPDADELDEQLRTAGGHVEGDDLVMPDGTRYALRVDPDALDDLPDEELYDITGELDLDEVTRRHTPQLPRLQRPDAHTKQPWVDYCVALGADRGILVGEGRHYDDKVGDYVNGKALTKDELIALAERLGG